MEGEKPLGQCDNLSRIAPTVRKDKCLLIRTIFASDDCKARIDTLGKREAWHPTQLDESLGSLRLLPDAFFATKCRRHPLASWCRYPAF